MISLTTFELWYAWQTPKECDVPFPGTIVIFCEGIGETASEKIGIKNVLKPVSEKISYWVSVSVSYRNRSQKIWYQESLEICLDQFFGSRHILSNRLINDEA